MNQEFVKYEQALALKELGFDEPCMAWYDTRKPDVSLNTSHYHSGKWNYLENAVSLPLYQQAFRWFREKDYYSEINVGCTQIDGAIGFSWRIWKPWIIEEWSPERPGEEWSYETYEEAESACLDKLIEICKNK